MITSKSQVTDSERGNDAPVVAMVGATLLMEKEGATRCILYGLLGAFTQRESPLAPNRDCYNHFGAGGQGSLAERRTLFQKARRWALWLVAVLLVLFALQAALLAFPQIVTSQTTRAGSVVIHYDGPRDPEIDELAAEVDRRIQGSELLGSAPTGRVFFFRNQRLYKLFARLARAPSEAQGFALSLVGNAFVSEPNVKALGARTGGLPKYSIWEGDPAHTIAHELAHLKLTERMGREQWTKLPHWKQEGLPEYAANIASLRADSRASLTTRWRVLEDDRNWSSTRGWDRVHYEAGLLVEFLIEVRGHTLADVLADRVTETETLADLVTWAESRE